MSDIGPDSEEKSVIISQLMLNAINALPERVMIP